MIIQIYLLFSFIGFFLILLGYLQSSELFKVIGFTIIAVLNTSILITDGIQYQTGEISLYNYTDNLTISIDTKPVYTTYYNHTITFLLSVLGIVGATIITWLEYKTAKKRHEEE